MTYCHIFLFYKNLANRIHIFSHLVVSFAVSTMGKQGHGIELQGKCIMKQHGKFETHKKNASQMSGSMDELGNVNMFVLYTG